MTVATKKLPNYTDPLQTGTSYPLAIDASMAVFDRMAGMFAPHEAATPNLTVLADAGVLFFAGALVAQTQQTVSGFVATGANQRIDRVVIDAMTGAASRVAGTQSASPVAPAIPVGKLPCCQVGPFTTSTTQIPNSMITDERCGGFGGGGGVETIQTLADGATINWNMASGAWAQVTLGGNRTLAAPTNVLDGKEYTLFVIQDGTGSRTLSLNSVFKHSLGVAPVLSTAAAAVDMLSYKARSGNLYGGILKGMA